MDIKNVDVWLLQVTVKLYSGQKTIVRVNSVGEEFEGSVLSPILHIIALEDTGRLDYPGNYHIQMIWL